MLIVSGDELTWEEQSLQGQQGPKMSKHQKHSIRKTQLIAVVPP